MKGSIVGLTAFLIGLLLLSGCVSGPPGLDSPTPTLSPQGGRPLYVIGVDGDYPPFTVTGCSGSFTGMDIDAARWIAARQGFDVKFVAVPWDMAIPALRNGTIDMIYSGMTITPGRQKEVDFTIPYYIVNTSMAVRSGSGITMNDFYAGNIRVGAQSGSADAFWVEDNLIQAGTMPAGNLVLYPDLRSLTDALMNGTIDASLADTPSMKRMIAGEPLVIGGEIPTDDQYAVAVRKTDPELLATMNDGLAQLMADPYWQQLLQKYEMEQ